VIQTILHVARLFPVIRFDAAMTLAKRHFHRLWFPGPGTSGAIPSRAENSMSQAEFNHHMPHEFWREVVDRVAAEVPGTLLLAEAFWLMEGYFVRTLGMHRVYNSAFMNMLRDEKNAEYRSVIKETLKFDPDIMKRYVNFMSNPDERTAIDQFGKGDKYFGVAVVMSTLPGLPMFGHGQVEGFTEKYGMEYRRPRYEETPDHWLVERHQRELAPLLKRRWLFAESSNFLLYDFYEASGSVNENVFAYSNRSGNERALIVYNNRYGEAHGTVDFSATYADKAHSQLRQRRLSEGLGFGGNDAILAWRDSLTGIEYLRRARVLAERGLTLDLHAYQCHVFLEWREMYATAEKPWDRLCDHLDGRGVANLEDALVQLELQPVHQQLRSLLAADLSRLMGDFAEHPRGVGVPAERRRAREREQFFDEVWNRCEAFLRVAEATYRRQNDHQAAPVDATLQRDVFKQRVRGAMRIPVVEALFPAPWPAAARRVLPSPSPQVTATAIWGPILAWCALESLAESVDAKSPEKAALDVFDRLRLREPFAEAFHALGFEKEEGWRVAARIKVLLLAGAGVGQPAEPAAKPAEMSASSVVRTKAPDAVEAASADTTGAGREAPSSPIATDLWLDPDVRWLTGAHQAEGHDYLVREPYEELLWWLQLPALLSLAAQTAPTSADARQIAAAVRGYLDALETAQYRVDLLQKQAKPELASAIRTKSEHHSPQAPESAEAPEKPTAASSSKRKDS